MLKSMQRLAGKFVEVLTGRTFLMMAGWALVSSAVSYASTSTTGLPWETPLQTVKHFGGWHRRRRHGSGLRWRAFGVRQTFLLRGDCNRRDCRGGHDHEHFVF